MPCRANGLKQLQQLCNARRCATRRHRASRSRLWSRDSLLPCLFPDFVKCISVAWEVCNVLKTAHCLIEMDDHLLKWPRFLRHQRSKVHQRSLAFVWKARVGRESGAPIVVAPKAEEFKEVWETTATGSSSTAMKKIGGRHRYEKFQWCLSEALKRTHKTWVENARFLTLLRDETKQRLDAVFQHVDLRVTEAFTET